MIKVPQFLTPHYLLRLFRALPGAEKALTGLVSYALRVSPESRTQCRHLIHYFGSDPAQSVSYSGLSLTHRRERGKRLWSAYVKAPFDLDGAVSRARSAPKSYLLGVVEGMCETSRVLALSNSQDAYHLAQETRKLASSLRHDHLTEEHRSELLALTHAAMANCLRLLNRFPEAEEEFSRSMDHLAQAGEAVLGLAPRILSLRASLETWKEDHARALATLAGAIPDLLTHPS